MARDEKKSVKDVFLVPAKGKNGKKYYKGFKKLGTSHGVKVQMFPIKGKKADFVVSFQMFKFQEFNL